MKRLLQVNTAGAWKHVQTLRCDPADGAGDLDNARTAVVLLATATDEAVAWRVIERWPDRQDRVLCSWTRSRGWRDGL